MLQLQSEFAMSAAKSVAKSKVANSAVAESVSVENVHEPVGVHYILEVYECPASVLNDLHFILESLRGAVKHARATLLNEVSHQFVPQGVTALMLLAESHISIHTWPESGYAAIDVFTCGSHTMPDMACAYLVEKLGAKRHLLFKMPRNTALPEA